TLTEEFMRRLLIPILILVILVVVVVAFLSLSSRPSGPPSTTPGAQPIDTTSTPVPTPPQLVPVVIAVQSLPRGFRITPDSVALRDWPKDIAPANAISDPAEVIGKITRTDV